MGIENILLLSCRSSYLDSDKVYPPLANLYLHQKLLNERPNINVTVTDNYNLDNDEWLKDIDAIGISIMTPQRAEAVRILNFVKEHKPNTKVWAGGPHAHYYFDSLREEPWDTIVKEDGYRAILQLVDGFEGKIIDDYIHPREYGEFMVKPARKENKEFLKGFNYKLNGRDSTTLLTAIGCPERCTFCEDAKTHVRYTPDHLVRQEIDDIEELGYKGVYIFDDIFALIQKRAEPIARELQKRGIIYRCNGQARLFNERFADMLKATGCAEIAFGAETGSQKILDNIQKRTTVAMNYNFVKLCRERGIVCKAFVMLGLPGEDLETVKATEEFIATSGIDDFQLAIYYPYKGTQIRDAIDRNDSNNDLTFEGEGLGAYGQKGGYSEAVVRTKALSRDDLLYHRDRLLKEYKPKSHKTAWDGMFFDTHLEKDKKEGLVKLTVGGK